MYGKCKLIDEHIICLWTYVNNADKFDNIVSIIDTIKDTDINVEPCCNKGCTPLPQCCQCETDSNKRMWDKYSKQLNDVLP